MNNSKDKYNEHKIEDLIKLEFPIEIAFDLIEEYAAKYNSKVHDEIMGCSVRNSIVRNINSIVSSTQYLDGFFIMPDEIHPEKLADYLFEIRGYDCDRNVVIYFIANCLKKRTGSLYFYLRRKSTYDRDGLPRYNMKLSTIIMGNEKYRKKFDAKCYERKLNNFKVSKWRYFRATKGR